VERPPSCCDFCGESQCLREYPTDRAAIKWYACENCTRLIEAEQWEQLIERSLTAYVHLRAVPDGEESALRDHVDHLVAAFRKYRLVSV
jgi:hypothetical protein